MIHRQRILFPVSLSAVLITVAIAAAARETASSKHDAGGPGRVLVLDGSPVHDAGVLRVHASNWGAIGSMPGSGTTFSFAPSAEWPAGSGVEYLFVAGVWVGGVVAGIPSVSTAAYEFEFRPTQDPVDVVYETAFGAPGGLRIPSAGANDDGDGALDEDFLDGNDNDLDGLIDEDFAAISDQMLSRIFHDDTPGITTIYPHHRPMHLAVREESYQFSHPDYDDFVGFTFRITNTGDVPIEDAWIGVFADGDAGHRNTPNYWEDDLSAYQGDIPVDHGAHGTQGYDFAYWYDADGDGGQTPGYCGIVILDHPTDPSGAGAPPQVGAVTYASFSGSAPFEEGGDPTNDFERYEALSRGTIQAPITVPRDFRTLVAVGPFSSIAAGETIEFSCALVVTPRNDFTHVQRVATAYHGLWFDLDQDPATGIEGREHQEHWYLPHQGPVPVTITGFDARVENGAVHLEWETWADEIITGFEILRAERSGDLRALENVKIPADQREYVDRAVEPGTRYDYQLVARGADGWSAVSARVGAVVPRAGLALRQNVPNPFAYETTLSFTLPQRGDVELAVFDVAGRRVATIFSGEMGAGEHDVPWGGIDDAGRRVGAGIYLCRITAGKQTVTRKLLVVR